MGEKTLVPNDAAAPRRPWSSPNLALLDVRVTETYKTRSYTADHHRNTSNYGTPS